MALNYIKIQEYCPQPKINFYLCFYGREISPKFRMKINLKSFRPKSSFVKSIPGDADNLVVVGVELAQQLDLLNQRNLDE
jgi:hypothetical protein